MKLGPVSKKDIFKAFEWYKAAADEGHGKACYKVGLCYKKGVFFKHRSIIPANARKAFWYFKRAADLCRESPEWVEKTAYTVAECYAYGRGVEKNYDAAFKYAVLAATASQLLNS